MRISKVQWENFRPFNTEVEFDHSEQIILFNWVNGTGKTSFLNSIAWCLTGAEIFKSARYMPNGEAVKAALVSDKSVPVSVEIEFRGSSGLTSTVRRRQVFSVKSIDEVIPLEFSFEVQQEDSAGHRVLNSVESKEWAQENFPVELIENFLVNGQAWATDTTKKRRGVEAVSRVDALRRVVAHLGKVQESYIQKSRPKSSTSGSDHLEAYELAKAERTSFEKRVNETRDEVNRFTEEFGDLQEWFDRQQSHNKNLAKLGGMDRELSLAKGSKDDALERFKNDLSTNLPAGLLVKQLTELEQLVRESADDSIAPEVIDRILTDGKCICGRESKSVEDVLAHLRKPSKHGTAIPKFLQSDVEMIRHAASAGDQAVGAAKTNWVSFRKASNEFQQLAEARELFLETLDMDANDGEVDSTAVAGVYTDMKMKENMLEAAPKKLESLAAEEARLKGLVLEAQGLTPTGEKFKALATFAQECLDGANEILSSTMESTRAEVQEEFERIFRRMSPDSTSWSTFSLTEDFEIEIRDEDGQDRKTGLSTGKSLALAFAFALALGKIAGYTLPLIADTPFGPMSKDVKKATVAGIRAEISSGGTSEGRQMFLLMHDVEFSDSVREAFGGLEPTIIEGHYDDDAQLTTFSKVQ